MSALRRLCPTRLMSFARAALVLAVTIAAPLTLRAVPLPHLKLTRSLPAADGTVPQAPKQLELWFSEAPELPMTKVTLATSAGAAVAVGKLASAGTPSEPGVVVPITGAMAAGKYTVTWRAASKDGHPMNGTFNFTVAK
ncbi:MAG: copper resistance protein CopC [Gemmatimonadaceae bacterium]|nr:copper resistance protein CopC [Gemmatimonadaceae bacterium]